MYFRIPQYLNDLAIFHSLLKSDIASRKVTIELPQIRWKLLEDAPLKPLKDRVVVLNEPQIPSEEPMAICDGAPKIIIQIHEIRWKLLKDAPVAVNAPQLKIADEVQVEAGQIPPPAPKSKRGVTSHPNFFDEQAAVVEESKKKEEEKVEVLLETLKNRVVEEANKTETSSQTIWERRSAKFNNPSMEAFEKKLVKGRVERCKRLFTHDANKAAIRLLQTFDDENLREVVNWLGVSSEKVQDRLFETGCVMRIAGILESDDPTRKERTIACFELVKEGKEQEAIDRMKTSDPYEQIRLCQLLVEEGKFDSAARIAPLSAGMVTGRIANSFMEKKEHDKAMELFLKLNGSCQDYWVKKCLQLFVDARDDLAIKLSKLRLDDPHRLNLCSHLQRKENFKEIAQKILDMMNDGKDKQELSTYINKKK